MFIDVADQRDLTFYHPAKFSGEPELSLLGVALLPVLGAGLGVFAWSAFRARRQVLVMSSETVWVREGALSQTKFSFRRDEIKRAKVRQSWLQRKLGTGDILIYTSVRRKPIVMPGMAEVSEIAERLNNQMAENLPAVVEMLPPEEAPVCPGPLLRKALRKPAFG